MPRFRLIDAAGSEMGIVDDDRARIEVGDLVTLPDGAQIEVLDVYDEEAGREGGVEATLAVDAE